MRISDYLAGGLDPVVLMRHVGMQPDPWQARVLRSNALRVLLLCARQTGKSSVAAVMAVHTAVFDPGSLVLLLSPSMRQSQELFRRCLVVYRALGRPVPIESETTMWLQLETGSRIISLPGGEGTIRGYSAVRLLLVDEAAQVADESYYAARPMVGVSGGRIVLMSTPAGRRGFFYETVGGESGWEQTRVPASECPRLRPEFLTAERLTMGDWRYGQEYELAFVDDEQSVFSEATIAAASAIPWSRSGRRPREIRGGPGSWAAARLQRARHPRKHLRRFAMESRRPPHRPLAWQTISGSRRRVGRVLSRQPLGPETELRVDATGVGRPVLDLLPQAHAEGKLPCYPREITITGAEEPGPGGRTIPKRDLIAHVEVLLATNRLHVAAGLVLARALREELASFRAKVTATGHATYEAGGSGHDDLVIAVALATWGAGSVPEQTDRLVEPQRELRRPSWAQQIDGFTPGWARYGIDRETNGW